ncbi:MAG: hypothetical protein KDI39_15550 [Pseudomonadales bacterium]|nr:hypothetical protein [Pseudomonadales bacterium]
MTKNALALCVVLCTNSLNAMALEAISEDEMSVLSAQDGISVMLFPPAAGWRANEASLTDTNGIAASIIAGYTSAGTVLAKNVGMNLCTNGAGGACDTISASPHIKLDFDMVGDHNGAAVGGGPMLNMAFSLAGGASKLRFFIDDIRLRNGQTGLNEKVLVDFVQNYVDIVPIGSSTLFALQLGNESLGHMLHFTNGNFGTIDFGTVAFLDASTPTNSVNFGFKLDQVDLTGTGFDVNTNGLIYTASNFGNGTMNATFSDVRMGGAAAASMGTFGLQGISVTNLAVTVAGKL